MAASKQHSKRSKLSREGSEVARASHAGECESLIVLKNLAKELVDRIEAACAARSCSGVPNPNKVVLNAAPESRLRNPGSPEVSLSEDQSCAVSEEKTTQKPSGLLGDYRSDVRGRDGGEQLDSGTASVSDYRPSSQPNPSGSITHTTTSGENSRPSSTRNQSDSSSPRKRTSTSSQGSMSSRSMLPLKKVNVGLDNSEIKRSPSKDAVRPRKGRASGLRSLVVPQEKRLKTPPANTKLVLQTPREEESVQALYKDVWADVVQNVFDEVFRDEEGEPARIRKQSPSSAAGPMPEWSIKYRSCRREINGSVSTISEPIATLKEGGSRGKAPVILPTLAKYHMDKIERYKKWVAENQLRDQQEYRPATAPADPYNVLNVYAERCAQRRATPQDSERSEVENQQRNSTARNLEGAMPRHKSLGKPYEELPKSKSGAVNLRPRSNFEEKLLETKNGITSQKEDMTSPRKNLQVASKKIRSFRFLDQQIEAFIQAHILQCCIIFKNVPLIFPTMEYQEEIQRLYST